MSSIQELKAVLDLAVDNLEGAVSGLQHALEKSQAAGGALYGAIEGSGNADVIETAQIVQAVNEEIQARIEHCLLAQERIRNYQATL